MTTGTPTTEQRLQRRKELDQQLLSLMVGREPGGCGCAKRQETLNKLIPFKGTTDGQ